MWIKSRRVYIGNTFVSCRLRVEGGKIQEIVPGEGEADVDYADRRIVPGFIDIHTHGAYGFDTNSADPEGLKYWQRRLPEEGVTSFLPTTVTAAKDILMAAVENVARVKKENGSGAHIIGIHLEGPYIDSQFRGAQPLWAVAAPSVEEFKEYQEKAEGLIRLITLAPEHDRDYRLTRYCAANGVTVSLGHSGATFEQAVFGAANGARSMTHTFNGMRPFGPRECGMAGAALRCDDLYAEIIGDGNHVAPDALQLFFRAKGRDKAIMVSDSIMCKGCEPGKTYRFSGLEVEIYLDGSAHLAKEGNFAGSTLRINEGLKVLVEEALVPFDAALNACTANPAALLGLDDRLGRLRAGYDADIVVLEDDYSVAETYCKGTAQLGWSR